MIEAPPLDRSLGIYYYLYDDLYLGDVVTHIKSPVTFKVYEVSLDGSIASLEDCIYDYPGPKGKYVHLIMCKEGLDTIQAIHVVRRVVNAHVYYAGLKDADSYSCQYLSVKFNRIRSRYYDLGRIKLCITGYGDYVIKRGYLLGNIFYVGLDLRSSNVDLGEVIKVLESIPNRYFLNYYGYQRFGTIRPVTHLVGRALVKREWGEAVKLIAGTPSPLESVKVISAREEFELGNYLKALKLFPKGLVIERRITYSMMKYGDHLKSLKSLGSELINLYLGAYQAYLFNKMLSRLIEYFKDVNELRRAYPTLMVPGSNMKLRNDACSQIAEEIIESEGINISDFLIKDLGASAKTYARESAFRPEGFTYIPSPKGLWLSFTLPSGSYASILLRELLRAGLPALKGVKATSH